MINFNFDFVVLVYVADLLNAKLASKCIRLEANYFSQDCRLLVIFVYVFICRELKEKYPLEDLQHLKRVRRISHKEKGLLLNN